MVQSNVPLSNLFRYISELNRPSSKYFQFQDEPGNPKIKNKDYWVISDLFDLFSEFRVNSFNGYSLQINDQSVPLLRLKRQQIPEIEIPLMLKEWISINQPLSFLPNLSLRNEIIREQINFGNSTERIKSYDELSTSLEKREDIDLENIPSVLIDWIRISDDADRTYIEKIETQDVIEKFEDNSERIKALENFNQVFELFNKKYLSLKKANSLYDSLHTLYYDLKGKRR